VQHLAAADAVLAKHIARVGGLRLRVKHTEDTFAALAESIVYQQLSGKAAATIFGRLRNVYPRGELHPRQVLGTEVRVLRGAGLSHNKVESLRDLAARALAGEVPALADLARMEDEAIVERLTRVRGVGRWTVEMLLIFRLGRPDVLPASDLGVRKGFARVFRSRRPREGKDGLPSAEEMAARAETWRPYRSVASWYLWRALDA
jgi:3-methyladenine DNA glycosylase/8-oxoguanine DNA glycosylase